MKWAPQIARGEADLNRKTPPAARARIDSRRRAGELARRYASHGALSSAASDAPIIAFERFAAGAGPVASARAAAAGAAPKRRAFLLRAAH